MARLLLLSVLFAGLAFGQAVITPASLPNGRLGSWYASTLGSFPIVASPTFVTLGVTGSTGPFFYLVSQGSLPPGVFLDESGYFYGVAGQQGAYTFVVAAYNAEEQVITQKTYTITVQGPLTASRTATIGSYHELPLTCPAFDTSYQYSAQGAIPAGLNVDPETGYVFGLPTGPAGSSTFQWMCAGDGVNFRVDFTYTIQPMPSLSFTGKVGTLLVENLAFGAGQAPFNYSVISGDPPLGVSVDPRSGQLSGTPSATGTFSFVVEKVDSMQHAYRVTINLKVEAGLSFSVSPATLSLEAVSDGPPVTATAQVISNQLGDAYSAVTRTTSGGRWLTVSPARGAAPGVVEVKATPAGLSPGRYAGLIDVQSASASGPAGMAQMQVALTVLPPAPDEVTVSPSGIEAGFRQGGASTVRQLQIGNGGSGPVVFDAQASTSNGGSWLSVSPSSGTASGVSPVNLRVSLDPTGLPPGTYKGRIALNAPSTGGLIPIPVTMTVSGAPGLLQLSQTGFSFRVEQGSSPLPTFFYIQEALGRAINWETASSTTSGGSWLAATPASGATGPQSSVDIAPNTSRLSPGRYYGQIAVTSDQAANSPQAATVTVKVEPPGTLLPPALGQSGMAFVAPPMLSNQLARGVFVGNPTARSQTLRIAASFPGGPIFFTATTTNARIAPGEDTTLVIRVDASRLTAGVYRGFVELDFGAGGPASRLEVLLVVAAGAPGGPLLYTAEAGPRPDQSACTPTTLHALVVEPGANFSVEQGQPVPVEAFVVNDCGGVPTDAIVWAQFSNGDEPVALKRNSRGGYSGLWTPLHVNASASSLKGETTRVQQQDEENEEDAQITIQANQLNVTGGFTQIGGSLAAAAGIPVISPGGAVSAASFASRNPLPPGAFVSIFGANLAPEIANAQSLPLPTELDGVSVTAAGQPVGLNFVSPGQINAVLPFGLTVDSAQQIVVKRGNALSTPESVSVSQAQPAVFTQNFSGAGLGVVVGVRPDGAQYLVGPGSRLHVGDAAVIYCAGLGLVDQPVDASAAAPADPLARTLNGVSVTIGGVEAEVFYAGLAPGFAGLYQINAIVEAGTPSGTNVPLVLTVNEIENPVVSVAVE